MSRRTSPSPITALGFGTTSHTKSSRLSYTPQGVQCLIRCFDGWSFEKQRTDSLWPYPDLGTVRPGVAEHCPWATGLCHYFQIIIQGSVGTLSEGGQTLDEEERVACWMNDSFLEFHNDNALWGYVIQAEHQYRISLGADPYLPRGLIESFLRVFKHFALKIPRGKVWVFKKKTLGVKIKKNPGGKFKKNPGGKF